jgi:hypothetical protein
MLIAFYDIYLFLFTEYFYLLGKKHKNIFLNLFFVCSLLYYIYYTADILKKIEKANANLILIIPKTVDRIMLWLLKINKIKGLK